MTFKNFRLTIIFSLMVFLLSCEEESTDEFEDPRMKFLGTWDVSEGCTRDAYEVEIISDPSNSANILIKNFWNMGNSGEAPSALVVGNNLYFNETPFFDSESEVSGEGNLDKNIIIWQYEVFDGGDIWVCDATYTKQ